MKPKPKQLRCFSLSQATRFGQHTVARVLTTNRDRASKLFLDFYRSKGLPNAKPGQSAGLVVGCIQLLLVEEARPELHDYQPNTVVPIGSAAPHRERQHAGLLLVTSPIKSKPACKPAKPKPNLIEPRRSYR